MLIAHAPMDKAAWYFRFFGLRASLETLRYTLLRDWSEGRFLPPPSSRSPSSPGKLLHATPESQGADFEFERSVLSLRYITPSAIRVEWETNAPEFPYVFAFQVSSHLKPRLEETNGTWRLSTRELRVEIDRSGGLSFFDGGGELIRDEHPPEFRDQGWRSVAQSTASSAYFGLGERSVGPNLFGGRYRMWNTDPKGEYGPGDDPLYICIPSYLCLQDTSAYLLIYENSHDGSFTLDVRVTAEFYGGPLAYYFISGGLKSIYQTLAALTGRPPLPPRWALGYHQSRFSYMSSAEVREIVHGFERHELPISAIHMDIDHMDGYRVFTFDSGRYGDIRALSEELTDAGVHPVVIVDPGIKLDPEFDVYRDGLESGAYVRDRNRRTLVAPVWPGASVFPDFTSPSSREWWGRQYRGLLDAGIRGFWHDMNEPTAFTAWGDLTLPRSAWHSLEGRSGQHLEAHNLYGLLMNRAAYEALRQARPDERPWLLTRSGWACVQNYAWTWTGDTESSWRSLRMTLATVIGLGLSGIPYSGPDVGGFAGSPSAELYLRWFQLAAFLPFFRTHSTNTSARREPWSFGEPTLSYIRNALELRYRLLPYLYTLAWRTNQNGLPMVRPLFWEDLSDPYLRDATNAFLLGDCLLVAPILEQGAAARELYIPQGRWYAFHSDEVYDGPRLITLSAALDHCPVLVRAGSVLPLENEEKLELAVFAPRRNHGSGDLYSDAGDGYGDWRLDQFRLMRSNNSLKLSRHFQGRYPFPYDEVEILLRGYRCKSAVVDGNPITLHQGRLRVDNWSEISFL